MIVGHKTIELFEKTLFTWIALKPPISIAAPMPDNEACFTYILEGKNISFSELEMVVTSEKGAMLSKCGNYISKICSAKQEDIFSSITIHFHKEVLEKIYTNDIPFFLKNPQRISCNSTNVEVTNLITNYFEGVLQLIKQPRAISEDILILKLKEVILLLINTKSSYEIQEIISTLFSKGTFDLKQVVKAHICSPISLNELAQLANRSLSVFKKDFKEVYRTCLLYTSPSPRDRG